MKEFAAWIAMAAAAALCAAPVGNPSSPELLRKGFFIPCDSWIDVRAGYEGDFVADGRMEQFDQGIGRVDSYEQETNSGVLTLNFLSRADLYGVFGSSKTKADWRFEDVSAGTISRIKMRTNHHFLLAVGGRAILYEWRKVFFGLGGRYSTCNNRPVWMTSNGAEQPMAGSRFRWRQWQVNFDVAYQIRIFTPYIGAKYSNEKIYLNNFPVPIAADLTGSNSFKNRDVVGPYVGCTLSSGNYFLLTLEGRLLDEEAVTVAADFRF